MMWTIKTKKGVAKLKEMITREGTTKTRKKPIKFKETIIKKG